MTEVGSSKRGLSSAARSGLVSTAVGQGLRTLLQTVGLLVLSRLLTPSEFGVFAIVAVFIGLAEAIREFGLSAAAIQADDLSPEQKTFLFWVNAVVGVALAVSVAVAAPFVAAAYGHPEIAGLLVASGAVFIINGIGTQFRAQLTRALQFGRLNVTDVLAQLVGLVVGIGAALLDAGAWSLLWQQIAQFGTATVMLVLQNSWRPGAPRWRGGGGRRNLLATGRNFAGIQVVNYVARNTDALALGLTQSASALGQYTRAFQLLTLPLNQLNGPATKVAFPVLVRLRNDNRRFDAYLAVGHMALMHVVTAGFLFSAAFGGVLVPVMLGPGWGEASDIFRVLAIAGVLQTAGYGVYWVFLGKALSGSNLRYTLVTRGLMVVVVAAAATLGTMQVAIAYTAAVVVTWPIGLWWIQRTGTFDIRPMTVRCLRVMLLYGASAAISWGAVSALPPMSNLGAVLLGLVLFLLSSGFGLAVFPAMRREVLTIVTSLSGRGRARTA